MKKALLIFVPIIAVILLFALSRSSVFNQRMTIDNISSSDPERFYVGVTYGGDSVLEAKQLIDKVKEYTNLFVLQSGTLQNQPDKINEICNYAVDSGLYFIVYFGSQHSNYRSNWLEKFDHRWDTRFLGVYFGDEMGGKMLDSNSSFEGNPYLNSIMKNADGSVSVFISDLGASVTYQPDGVILLTKNEFEAYGSIQNTTFTTYYPDGKIVMEFQEVDGPRTRIESEEVSPTYEELLNLRPFQTYDETAERFIETQNSNLERGSRSNWNITAFTSDYALYWFDYLSGYDVLLAQLGWNHTLAQDIALVRGAASLQNKTWGVILTWKYTEPPYLDSGDSIYEQMRAAYEAGAKYAVVFNYAENMTEPYGTLQEEHFEALERFWNEVVQNTNIKQGTIKAEAVLVLPHNYGWGMRNPKDTIWGLWKPDEKSAQIWKILQNCLNQYGLELDIVYDDEAFSPEGKYAKVYFWNKS